LQQSVAKSVEGCLACDLASGRQMLPGGQILNADGWIVEHCVGPLTLGTLIVKPKRHVVRVAELSAEEAEALGPLLRRVAAAVDELTEADQVYVCLWSHAGREPVHIHFVVQPVSRDEMVAHNAHGPTLQVALFEAGEVPPQTQVEEFSARAREALAATS
jgi:diadenosine tetraphosphate (Ap4A) HIT family hydrolase